MAAALSASVNNVGNAFGLGNNNMNNKLFELIEELSDKIDRGMKDCFELNDFILFKNDIDWRLLKIIIKEENEEGFSNKWDELEIV